MENCFYLADGHELGPIDFARLKALAAAGIVSPSQKVREVGSAKWIAASQVSGLFSSIGGETGNQLASVTNRTADDAVLPDSLIFRKKSKLERRKVHSQALDISPSTIPFTAWVALAVISLVIVGYLSVKAVTSLQNVDNAKPPAHVAEVSDEIVALRESNNLTDSSPALAPKVVAPDAGLRHQSRAKDQAMASSAANDPVTTSRSDERALPKERTPTIPTAPTPAPAGAKVEDIKASAKPASTKSSNTLPLEPIPQLPEFARTTSSRYLTFGYSDLRLGATLDETAATLKMPLYQRDSGFITDGDKYQLWFDNGVLRMIAKTYEGNTQAYVDELVTKFGKAPHEDIYSSNSRDPVYGATRARVDAFYFFPRTIVCVSVVSTAEHSNHNGPTNVVGVEVFDKEWLIQQVTEYSTEVATTLDWINVNVRPSQQQNLSTLPAIPGTTKEYSALGVRNDWKWRITGELSDAVFLKTNQDPYVLVEGFKYKKQLEVSDTPPSGAIRVRVDFEKRPHHHNPIVSKGALPHLTSRVVSRIAQLRYPPTGMEVRPEQDHSSGIEFYSWKSIAGWTVEVGPDWVGLITSRVNL